MERTRGGGGSTRFGAEVAFKDLSPEWVRRTTMEKRNVEATVGNAVAIDARRDEQLRVRPITLLERVFQTRS